MALVTVPQYSMKFENLEDKHSYDAFVKLFPQYKHKAQFTSRNLCKRSHDKWKSLTRNWNKLQATLSGFSSATRAREKRIHARGLTVDHIVPLFGCDELGTHIVCGLNVPWNLRGETQEMNSNKGNSFVDNAEAIGIILSVVKQTATKKES